MFKTGSPERLLGHAPYQFLILAVCLSILTACVGSKPLSTEVLVHPGTATSPMMTVTPPAYPSPLVSTESGQLATRTAQVAPTQTVLPSVGKFPDSASYIWAPVVSGLARPLWVGSAVDGSQRLFIEEQRGVVRIFSQGVLQSVPFLDIHQRVGSQGDEQGLLGLAFDPAYLQNGNFFVDYTDLHGDTVIARYRVSRDANLADAASEEILLKIKQPYPNHNGGCLAFGPDGYLYIGMGDGGSQGDPNGNGQSLTTLLGKILRIDVSPPSGYSIPSGNPFANGVGGKAEIWAIGLRNPWRFSFDASTGDLYIADVGQDAWEEIDFLPAGSPGGLNLGWNYKEGTHPYKGVPPSSLALVDPVLDYSHAEGCSVIGGFVYRGKALPEFYGVYIYGDNCSGNIWGMFKNAQGGWQSQLLFKTSYSLSSFGLDEAGELYLTDLKSGKVFRLARK